MYKQLDHIIILLQCFCKYCLFFKHLDVNSSIESWLIEDKIFFVGKEEDCFLNVEDGGSKNVLILFNLMFWPTVLVVIGSVGLFFSLLNLSYEERHCLSPWILCNRV